MRIYCIFLIIFQTNIIKDYFVVKFDYRDALMSRNPHVGNRCSKELLIFQLLRNFFWSLNATSRSLNVTLRWIFKFVFPKTKFFELGVRFYGEIIHRFPLINDIHVIIYIMTFVYPYWINIFTLQWIEKQNLNTPLQDIYYIVTGNTSHYEKSRQL